MECVESFVVEREKERERGKAVKDNQDAEINWRERKGDRERLVCEARTKKGRINIGGEKGKKKGTEESQPWQQLQ